MRICIWGGGASLAQHVIEHYLSMVDPTCATAVKEIVAVCRRTQPTIKSDYLKVLFQPVVAKDLDGEKFDVLITMTGGVINSKLENMSDHVWQESLSANLTPVFKALRTILPRMNDGGNVVVVGSIIGSTGGYGCTNYASSKAGLIGLVKGAANENAKRRIKVNLLELGYVDCGMGAQIPEDIKAKILSQIPLGRFASAKEVVEAIDFLANMSYMTGNILSFAGGMR